MQQKNERSGLNQRRKMNRKVVGSTSTKPRREKEKQGI